MARAIAMTCHYHGIAMKDRGIAMGNHVVVTDVHGLDTDDNDDNATVFS